MKKTDLLQFKNTHNYNPQSSKLKQILWYITNRVFFKTIIPFPNKIKRSILILFGAKIKRRLVIKPSVSIKFPWKLQIGNNTWIGENVWIDNLENVVIGNNVCISQGALLLTGNHDYTITSFDYRNAPIIIEDGCWVGAKSVVCPGVTLKSHSILTVGSIATKDLDPYTIYQGNPAQAIRKRVIKE